MEQTDDLSVSDRWDRVFRLFSREPRRQLILALSDRSPTAWVALPDAALSSQYRGTRRELQIALQHHHLPALADANYVKWRVSPFEATRGPNFEEAKAVMDVIHAGGDDLPEQLIRGCESLEKVTRN